MPAKLDRLDPALLAHNPRATLRAWKEYEHIVLAAHKHHPQVFVYEPPGKTPATVASRLRDAIRGAIAFGYCDSLAPEALLAWYGETTITHNSFSVRIGPRGSDEVVPLTPAQDREVGLEFTSLTLSELNAFVLLLGNGRIQGPVIVHKYDTTGMLEHANVEKMYRPNGTLVLL